MQFPIFLDEIRLADDVINKLKQAVIQGETDTARKAAEEALSRGIEPAVAIKEGLNQGMEVVGEMWRRSEFYLPDVMMSVDAMKSAIEVLKAQMRPEEAKKLGRGVVVVGTVYGDIHDIGKNIVAAMLEAAGYEVHDVGVDAPSLTFIDKAHEVKADIIALSCLISPSLGYQSDVIRTLKDMNRRNDHFVILGGGAVTPDWARGIGADGYGRLADHAVRAADVLMKRDKSKERLVNNAAFLQ